ncbi:MAG TPA: ABC transporter substrate-binding protein [Xanthobacteraceae bacterium]
MNRRRLLLGGGAAATWPLAARAQGPAPVRRLGVLTDYAQSDPQGRERVATLQMGLQQLGWIEGRNLHVDYCWGAADLARIRECGSELVRLAPDAIWVNGTPPMQAARHATDTIPIVFANVADPVATGMVASLVAPGGNVTGFANFEYGIAGKWLEILREVSPGLARFLFVHNAESEAARGLSDAISAAARAVGATVTIAAVRDAADIERSVAAFGREGGGLIVQPDGTLGGHRELIVALAGRHRLPAVYPFRYYARAGGLIAYGVDLSDIIRRSAQYVDRVLKGARPAELPVQFPTRFELVINLRTAKALGLEGAPTLLARADEVIE